MNGHTNLNRTKTMQDRENMGLTSRRDNGAPQPGDDRPSNGNGSELHPDQELVYRLKTAIDQRGRYSFRLDDMAAGFAAGQNISNAAARRAIEDRFTEQMGHSPKEYLDRHYDERRELNQGSNRSFSRQRDNGQDRSR